MLKFRNPQAVKIDGMDVCPEHGAHNGEYCPGCKLREVLRLAYSLALTAATSDIFTDAPECRDSVKRERELGDSVVGRIEALFPDGITPLDLEEALA